MWSKYSDKFEAFLDGFESLLNAITSLASEAKKEASDKAASMEKSSEGNGPAADESKKDK